MGGVPLAAGGSRGEWIGGSYAAVAAIAYARRAQAGEGGEFIDVLLLEAMAITMGGLGVVAAQFNPASGMPARSLEIPSIEKTADGYVGFCTITGQQFQDFLVLIERFEWLDDPDLASFAGGLRRREEFSAAVHEWTSKRTTAEVIEAASALRIPVAPIGAPDTVTQFDHFVERGVFVGNPAGFVQPRPPYRITGTEPRPFEPAPLLGDATGDVDWTPRQPTVKGGGRGLAPLRDIRIMDLTAFWAGPSGSLMLASLGADVIKVEDSSGRTECVTPAGVHPGASNGGRQARSSWLSTKTSAG